MRNVVFAGGLLIGLLALQAPALAQENPGEPLPGPMPGPAPGPAPAPRQQEEADTFERHAGFEGGARLGFAVPLGKLDKSASALSDTISATIPLWLDAGYRVNGLIYVGGYAILAPGITNGDCGDCSATSYRIGANVHFHFIPEGKVDPWLGVGIGYEAVTFSVKQNGVSTDAAGKGWELANLQFGTDIRVNDLIRIAPYTSLGLDLTTNESISQGALTRDTSDFDKSFHFWLNFGARVVFNP